MNAVELTRLYSSWYERNIKEPIDDYMDRRREKKKMRKMNPVDRRNYAYNKLRNSQVGFDNIKQGKKDGALIGGAAGALIGAGGGYATNRIMRKRMEKRLMNSGLGSAEARIQARQQYGSGGLEALAGAGVGAVGGSMIGRARGKRYALRGLRRKAATM